MEHGHSLVIPPHFDGNNYAYWKVRMKAFLKSIDERVWNSVEYGWEKPTTPVSEWQTSQKEAAVFNSKAMNAFFNVVSMDEPQRILKGHRPVDRIGRCPSGCLPAQARAIRRTRIGRRSTDPRPPTRQAGIRGGAGPEVKGGEILHGA